MLDIFDQQPEQSTDAATLQVHVGGFAFPVHYGVGELMDLLQENESVHWVSKGEWSAIDLLVAILARHDEPAKIYLSSYAFSEKPARIIANLVESGKITWIRCIIDSRVDVRSQPALQLLRGCADKLVMMDTHAKVTVLHMGEHFYTIVGSANYTSNKRFEAGIISRSAECAAFHKKWIKDAIDISTTSRSA